LRPQVQTVTLVADSALTAGTTFALSYEGVSTASTLNILSTVADVRVALDALTSVATVSVTRTPLVAGNAGPLGVTWTITFTHLEEKVQGAGNIALLRCAVSGTAATNTQCIVSEEIKGTHPVDTLRLSGLTPGQQYFARVTPFNAIGAGKPSAVVRAGWACRRWRALFLLHALRAVVVAMLLSH
jgi:hypothetical protein